MKKCVFLWLALAIALPSLLVLSFVSPNIVNAAGEDFYVSNQTQVTKPERLWEDSSYIIFSQEEESNGLSYIYPEGVTRYERYYSETATFKGVHGRQVYKENSFTFKLEDGFADQDDTIFCISLDYWDYGSDGYFFVDYISRETGEKLYCQVLKLGLLKQTSGAWFRVNLFITDMALGGKMEGGGDFVIRTNAFNTYSRVEVRNVSRAASGNEFLGTFNGVQAKQLNAFDLFDGYGKGDAFEPCLEKELTREEALKQMLISYGLKDEAVSVNLKPGVSNVGADYVPYVCLAQSLGLIKQDERINGSQTCPQNELVKWYMRLVGVPESLIEDDLYKAAKKYGVIEDDNIICQPERPATVDALVGMAMNVFSLDHYKTHESPFSKFLKTGEITSEDVAGNTGSWFWKWILTHDIKAPKTVHKDWHSGYTYYSFGFMGLNCYVPYFTQKWMSTDNKKLYFCVNSNMLMEYNIETEMCHYIGDVRSFNTGFIVSPLNNLWWTDRLGNIWKLNLDSYEYTKMGEIPEEQIGTEGWIQINDDETLLGVFWEKDYSGTYDSTKATSMPILDLTTGEWDRSHIFGFPTPYYNPMHICINPNPKYKHLISFCHEGSSSNYWTGQSQLQYDRNWIMNTDTDESYNIFKQKWLKTPEDGDPTKGLTGQLSVHEFWSPDGEWLCTITGKSEITGSPAIVNDATAVMMRHDGSDKWYVPADYSYAHTYSNPGAQINHGQITSDMRWIVGDTANYNWNGKFTGDLHLIDTCTGETIFLAHTPNSDNVQPHVQFSYDDKMIFFGVAAVDNSNLDRIGWMDVSEFTQNPRPGGRFDISQSCESFSYEGNFDHYVKPSFDENGKLMSVYIPPQREMYVDVKKTVIESDNTPATITITYEDKHNTPIRLRYKKWNEYTNGMYNTIEEKMIYIERKNTGKILTKTVDIDDICLGNEGDFRSDFKIGALTGDAVIYSVEVSVPEYNNKEK